MRAWWSKLARRGRWPGTLTEFAARLPAIPAGRLAISCDLFDTVITRLVAPPEAAFLLLGQELIQEGTLAGSPEYFARARMAAEKVARRHEPSREVTLAAIYRELAAALHWPAETAERLLERECEIEARLLRRVPETAALLDVLRTRGESIHFLSDMYLPPDFLREYLEKHALWQAGDLLWVSGEEKMSKSRGTLFAKLRTHGANGGRAIVHLGNDHAVDILAARPHGVHGAHFESGNLNRFEQALAGQCWATSGVSGLLAGVARMTRLSCPAKSEHERAIIAVAASVAAPLLCSYVRWVLQRAARAQVERLYFIARGGATLAKIAQRLGWAGEICYLHCSRRAAACVGLQNLEGRDLRWLWAGGAVDPDARRILARAGLAPEEVSDELKKLDLPGWETPLKEMVRSRFQGFFESPAVRKRIEQRARENCGLFHRYLEQEGVRAPGAALVDTGWRGHIQRAMECPLGFYFGLEERLVSGGAGAMEAWFFDKTEPSGYGTDLPMLPQAIEMFCAADHGSTIGYEEREGRVWPILQSERNPRVEAWGFAKMEAAILRFAELWAEVTNGREYEADLRPAAYESLRLFWLTPTRAETEAWGSFPYDDETGGTAFALAEPFACGDLWRRWRHGATELPNPLGWPAGTMVRTPAWLRAGLRAATALRAAMKGGGA